MGRVQVEREGNLPFSVAEVWQIVTDVHHWQWRSDLAECEVLDSHRFVEYPKGGKPIHFHTLRCEEEQLWEFSMSSPAFTGKWSGIFVSTPTGCRLRFTENLEMKNRFLPKWVAKIMLSSYQRRYFKDLRKELRTRHGCA